MKRLFIVLGIAIAALAAGWKHIMVSESGMPPKQQPEQDVAEAVRSLREKILQASPAELGLKSTGDVWGVLMETGYAEGSATMVALADGNASIYFSSGGGVIGGHAHEPVRRAAIALVALAGQYAPTFASAPDFPLPGTGRVRFYVLTTAGVVTADEDERTLGEGEHPLSPLFYAGHEVIGQLRIVAEGQ